MAYRVELTKNAEAELEELYLWVVDRAPSQGAAWFNALEQAILSLEHLQNGGGLHLRALTGMNRFASRCHSSGSP
jgi:plasmid stabilization system protein ParE